MENKLYYYLALETYFDNDDFEPLYTTKNVVIESEKQLPNSLYFEDKKDSWSYQLTLINKKEYNVLKKFFENIKYEEML